MAKLCQKFTANIQEVMRMTRDFDELEKVRSNILQLQSARDNINDELSSVLSEYQEFLWPIERYPRIKILVGQETLHELEDKMKENGVTSTELAELMVKNLFKESRQKIEIEIITLSLDTLGFWNHPDLTEIYEMARRKNLQPCSIESAINFAIVMKKESLQDRTLIATPPFQLGGPNILAVADGGQGKFLGSSISDSGLLKYNPRDVFAFCLKKINE